MDHDQEHDRENERDHGAGNAKREQAPQVQDDLQETSKPAMNSSSKPAPKAQSLGSPDVEARSGGIEVNTSSELSSSIPADRFLRSDEKSQRDSRHVFTHVRKRIGGYMDGESRMARIAIDLPGGGRLGIKMRFVGNQLEGIFATEDMALRAALLEDWRRLAREMSDGESRLLPPAFAQENYEGIVRGEWNEAA